MLQETIRQIPIRHDAFSYIIAFGAFYSIFLALLILFKRKANAQANNLLAAFLLCIGLALADLFLGYTSLMKYTLHLNDTTEVFVLLLFPLVYLILVTVVERRQMRLRAYLLHFALPLAYFLYEWLYFIQGPEVKLNAHIGAFLDGQVDYVQSKWTIDTRWMWLKEHFRLLIFLMAAIYMVLGIRFVYRAVREGQLSLFRSRQKSKYAYVRNLILLTLLFLVVILVVYFNFETDAGDHYIGVFLTYGVLIISAFIIHQSRIFENAWIMDKYETSGLRPERADIVQKARTYLEAEPYYLDQDCSLQTLADRLGVPANYLSQSINTELSQNFNEFINTYRIEAARQRLLSEEFRHLNIEGIGNSVGFKSKSAFYAAFKRHAGLTPSQYIRREKGSGRGVSV